MAKKTDKLSKRFSTPARILVFDGSLKLKAMFQSYNAAEKITGIAHQRILNAVNGKAIAVKKHYWRELVNDDDICDTDDLNRLTLIEFDAMMGQDRMIYATRKMQRGEEILESQYKNRFQVIKSRNSRLWRKSK